MLIKQNAMTQPNYPVVFYVPNTSKFKGIFPFLFIILITIIPSMMMGKWLIALQGFLFLGAVYGMFMLPILFDKDITSKGRILCTLYPDYMEWTETTDSYISKTACKVFFDQVEGFYIATSPVQRGPRYQKEEKVLFFVPKNPQDKLPHFSSVSWLSGQDRARLLELLTAKGLVFYSQKPGLEQL